MKTVVQPIPSAGLQLSENRHVCAFSNSDVYDLAKFAGNTVIDIKRTHPMIIIGGLLHRNPFHLPPREFLPELRERRSGQTELASAKG